MIEIGENIKLKFDKDLHFQELPKGNWFLAEDFYGGNVRRGTQLLLKITDREAVYTDGVVAEPDRLTKVRKVLVTFSVELPCS